MCSIFNKILKRHLLHKLLIFNLKCMKTIDIFCIYNVTEHFGILTLAFCYFQSYILRYFLAWSNLFCIKSRNSLSFIWYFFFRRWQLLLWQFPVLQRFQCFSLDHPHGCIHLFPNCIEVQCVILQFKLCFGVRLFWGILYYLNI